MNESLDDEARRLLGLRDLAILDTPEEEAFDRITRVTARLFRAPIALVTLVDEERQWFKSRVGLQICETARDLSICAHAMQREKPFVVEDTHLDPAFKDNALVTGPPYIRFYAGARLRTSTGVDLGALCVIDRVPRPAPPAEDLEVLTDLAATVTLLFEQRRLANALAEENQRRQDAERDAVGAKELADKATASMRAFFSRMSHDLRTPLGAVLGYAEFLRDTELSKEQREDVEEIHAAGKRMVELIDELLQVSRREH